MSMLYFIRLRPAFQAASWRAGSVPSSSKSRHTCCIIAANAVQIRHLSNEVPPKAKVPTIEEAAKMPLKWSEVSNEALFVLAEQDHHEACKERLVRNVMVVDNVEWHEAHKRVIAIERADDQVLRLATLPHKVGLLTAAVAGFGSIPMVFHFGTARWFNHFFVTTSLPDPEDLQTTLEVGSWTWNWMEPPLGTASFVLLTLQFIRNQMLNMDMKPYTAWVQHSRAERLLEKYPQYDKQILGDFARTSSLQSRRK